MKNVQPSIARPGRSAGFTILELMIAVAVLGILVGIAVPSFNGIIRQNRLATYSNDLLTAAAITRNEAVKRGARVTVCPVSAVDANACRGNAQWSEGWIVFTDDGPIPGTVEPASGEIVLQRWPASTLQRVNIVNISAPALTSISYIGSGATTLAAAQTNFTISGVECSNPNGLRTVNIIRAGRARVIRSDC